MGEYYVITVNSPLAESPKVGDLFQFGEVSKESIAAIIKEVEPVDKLCAKVVCLEYKPEVFAVGTVPPWTPTWDWLTTLSYRLGNPQYPWYSCSQAILWAGNEIWFITDDMVLPITTLRIIKYNLTTGRFTLVYTTTQPMVPYNYGWIEPAIDTASNSTLRIVVMIRRYDPSGDFGVDVFVFAGEVLTNTLIGTDLETYGYIYGYANCSHFLLLDSSGHIHIIRPCFDADTGDKNIWDFKSTDNGATFTAIKINTTPWVTSMPHYIREDSSGNLFVWIDGLLYKSTDNGDSWSLYATTGLSYEIRDFIIINDVFYVIDKSTDDVYIKKSTDGTTWTTVHTVAGKGTYLCSGVLGYDGTYYYGIINYRNATAGNPEGYNEVYRSNDGITWSMLSTFIDDSKKNPGRNATAHLIYQDGMLGYAYYYSETKDTVQENVYWMTFWTSSDDGITWTTIQTPFYDMTGGAVAPIDIDDTIYWDMIQIISIQVESEPVSQTPAGMYIYRVGIHYNIPSTLEAKTQYVELQYRPVGTTTWETLPSVPAQIGVFFFEIEAGITYQVRLRSIFNTGAFGDWSSIYTFIKEIEES